MQQRLKLLFFLTLIPGILSLPPAAVAVDSETTIAEALPEVDALSTLLEALTAAELAEVFAGGGPFTVFAPTNDAFSALPDGTVESLLRPANRQMLVELLSYHIVEGRLFSEALLGERAVTTLAGFSLPVRVDGQGIRVGQARVRTADIPASNGVIHAIDAVLVPEPEDMVTAAMRAVIERAINRGAPLFNMGQQRACADIYEVAAYAILMMGQDALDLEIQDRLAKGLEDAAQTQGSADRAWALRYAFDEVLEMIR